MTSKITSKAEALAYVAGDLIECLECGKKYSFLPNHLRKSHSMTSQEYRLKFNIPAGIPLAGAEYRNKQRDKMRRMIDSGTVTHWHLAAAVEMARTAGRGERRDFDLREQANRIMRSAGYEARTLPPGSRRADGRDADREREYQRAWRALKRGDNSLMSEYKKRHQMNPQDKGFDDQQNGNTR